MGAVTYLRDRLVNLVSGMGTSKDKHASDTFAFYPLSRGELESAYRGNWIARKVIDLPPFDSVREWRDWQAEEDDIELIEEAERNLCVRHKIMEAMSWARLYGGSALLMGVDSGSAESELDVEKVGQDALQYLHVLPRWEITAGELNRDVLDPYFRQPQYYEVASSDLTARVHPSRVIPFVGNVIPGSLGNSDPWGDSVLDAVQHAVKAATLGSSSVASLLHEAKIDVIKVPDLMTGLATAEYTTALTSRFGLANTLKSSHNMLLLDSLEEWEQKTLSFEKLPEIMQLFLQIAAGAADIPATRFLSQSPGGLNATGESDLRNYYDKIAADQELKLRPACSRLDEVLLRSVFGTRPEEIYYEWAPLWQLGEVERADVEKKFAETLQIYVNSALVPTDALAVAATNRMIETGAYPGIESALDEAEQDPAEFALGEKEKAEEAETMEREASVEALKAKAATPIAKDSKTPARRRRRRRRRYVSY